MTDKGGMVGPTGGKDFDEYASRLFGQAESGKKHFQTVGLTDGFDNDDTRNNSPLVLEKEISESPVLRKEDTSAFPVKDVSLDRIRTPRNQNMQKRPSMFAVKPVYKPNLSAYSDDSESDTEQLLHFCVEHMQFCSPEECDFVEHEPQPQKDLLKDVLADRIADQEKTKGNTPGLFNRSDSATEMKRDKSQFELFVSPSLQKKKLDTKTKMSALQKKETNYGKLTSPSPQPLAFLSENAKSPFDDDRPKSSANENYDDGIVSPRLVVVRSMTDIVGKQGNESPLNRNTDESLPFIILDTDNNEDVKNNSQKHKTGKAEKSDIIEDKENIATYNKPPIILRTMQAKHSESAENTTKQSLTETQRKSDKSDKKSQEEKKSEDKANVKKEKRERHKLKKNGDVYPVDSNDITKINEKEAGKKKEKTEKANDKSSKEKRHAKKTDKADKMDKEEKRDKDVIDDKHKKKKKERKDKEKKEIDEDKKDKKKKDRDNEKKDKGTDKKDKENDKTKKDKKREKKEKKDKKKSNKLENDGDEVVVLNSDNEPKPPSRNDDSSVNESPVDNRLKFLKRRRLFGDHRTSSNSSLTSDNQRGGYFDDLDLEPFEPQKYKDHLKMMHEYAGVIIEDRENMKDFLAARKEVIIDQLIDMVEPVMEKIYKLKAEMLANYANKHENCTTFIMAKMAEAAKLRQESRQLWAGLQLGEDFDDFDKYRDIIDDTTNESKEIETSVLKSEEEYGGLKYELESNQIIEQLKAIEKYGEINVTEDVSRLPPFLSTPSDDDDKGSLVRVPCTDDNQKNCGFTGIAYVSSEDVVLCDWHHGNIKKVNKLGVVSDRLKFENSPWDVTLICANKIAVTVPKSETVYIVECEPHLHAVRSFKTDGECFGICRLKTNFAVTCEPWSNTPSVKIYTEDGKLVKMVQTINDKSLFKCPLHIATDFFQTILYVSDATEDTVTCLTQAGQVRFVYEHTDLEYPTGVETDRNNNLFICGKSSANIHKINNKGELIRILLKHDEEVKSPRALCFHPYGDFMALTDLCAKNCSIFFKTRQF